MHSVKHASSIRRSIQCGIGSLFATTGSAQLALEIAYRALDALAGHPHHEANWGIGMALLPIVIGVCVLCVFFTISTCSKYFRGVPLLIALTIGLSFWIAAPLEPRFVLPLLPFVHLRQNPIALVVIASGQLVTGILLLKRMPKPSHQLPSLPQ